MPKLRRQPGAVVVVHTRRVFGGLVVCVVVRASARFRRAERSGPLVGGVEGGEGKGSRGA